MSTVLLVDDEPQMGALVRMCLEPLGATVVQAANLPESIAAGRAWNPSVLLLDLQLAEDDGLSYLPAFRREPSLDGVPIIAFTVHDSRRDEAFAHGVDGFIAKPFRTEGLRNALRSHLAVRSPRGGRRDGENSPS
jgi:CheY-like chemotaxis protein